MKARLSGVLLLWVMPLAAAPAAAAPRLDYSVTCGSLDSALLGVTLTVTGWETDTLSLQGVPVYLDNPLAEGEGAIVQNLVVAGGGGEEPAGLRWSEAVSAGEVILLVTPVPDTLVVRYQARVAYRHSRQTSDYPIHLPFMDRDRAWLYGNYLFCPPRLAATDPASLRTAADIRLRFDLGEGVPLVGLPAPELSFATLHELLSVQFGLGRFLVEETAAAGLPVRLIFKDRAEFGDDERAALSERTVATVAGLTDFFGTPAYPAGAFFYFRGEGMGGLEGSYACQAYAPAGLDLSDLTDPPTRTFTEVALHEFFHTWNPIALFALEDPWFKEGVTSYYGQVLTVRLGFGSVDDYREAWQRDAAFLEGDFLVPDLPLTDPQIWFREYDGENWRQLTYARGHAVALLLDVTIREASANAHNLDEVLALLARRHLHGGFSHAQLMEAITDAARYDPRAFFLEYVDGTRVPTPDEVRAALEMAVDLGVFAGSAR